MRDDVRAPLPCPTPRPGPAADWLPASVADAADAELIGRLAAGDPSALAPLYSRHRRRVYQFAMLWTGQPACAADVTQDVFLHLLRHAGDFDPGRGAPLAWLLGIARNFARRRSGVRDAPIGDDDCAAEPPSPFADERDAPEARLAERRDVDRLRRAIAALPTHYRDVLVLVELAERSYAETALICGCELNTVRSRLSRARALLARCLAGKTAEAAAPARGRI
jgi:RNA polymerase sigma-70 factor (ECF subfamily)